MKTYQFHSLQPKAPSVRLSMARTPFWLFASWCKEQKLELRECLRESMGRPLSELSKMEKRLKKVEKKVGIVQGGDKKKVR